MIIKNLLSILFIFSAISCFGQTKEQLEKIKSFKVAYFTEELSLSTDEAAEFWPIYNKFEEAQIQMWRSMRKRAEETSELKTLSESEAKKQLDSYIEERTNEHERTMKLYRELLKILPANKVLLLPRAEENFRRKLMRLHREQRSSESHSNVISKKDNKSTV